MIRNTFWGFVLACACTLPSVSLADSVGLNPNHPDRYTVVKGDTLWGISERFLSSPWRWPDVWHVNQHIKNPHLIYPGDEIELSFVDGEPQLRLHRGGTGGVVRLSPHIRESDLTNAIPTIPLDAIRQFILYPTIVDANELAQSPYVVAFPEDHVLAGEGDRAYVRSIDTQDEKSFTIYRQGDVLKDPETHEILGYEAKYVGDAKLQLTGDPATVVIVRSANEIVIGDRLKPANEANLSHFSPHAPKEDIRGYIISVSNGVTRIGQFQTVVINKGRQDNIEIGHVLTIWQAGGVVRDLVSDNLAEKVKLPDEKAGYLMVYKTFERVSYGLVMKAEKEMQLLDIVRTP